MMHRFVDGLEAGRDLVTMGFVGALRLDRRLGAIDTEGEVCVGIGRLVLARLIRRAVLVVIVFVHASRGVQDHGPLACP